MQETLNLYTSELLWQLLGTSLKCWGIGYFCCNKLWRCSARELKIYIHIKLVYSFHYSIICNSWKKQLKSLSTDKKIIQNINTMESYSKIKKRKEALLHTITWMSLEFIVRQIQENLNCLIPLVWTVQARQIPADRQYIFGQIIN